VKSVVMRGRPGRIDYNEHLPRLVVGDDMDEQEERKKLARKRRKTQKTILPVMAPASVPVIPECLPEPETVPQAARSSNVSGTEDVRSDRISVIDDPGAHVELDAVSPPPGAREEAVRGVSGQNTVVGGPPRLTYQVRWPDIVHAQIASGRRPTGVPISKEGASYLRLMWPQSRPAAALGGS